MIRIGIDPGVRECGVAIEWGGGRAAFLVRSTADLLHMRGVEMAAAVMHRSPIVRGQLVALCVEGQQVYRAENSKGDPNDMVKLATVAGIMVGALSMAIVPVAEITAEMPLPRTWKGNTPKAIHHERLARDFPHWVEPVAADTPKSLQHHVWDAVGLLEWHKGKS